MRRLSFGHLLCFMRPRCCAFGTAGDVGTPPNWGIDGTAGRRLLLVRPNIAISRVKVTLTSTLMRPSGAVSGGSTVLSGLFSRRIPVSEDLCLLLDLDAGATVEGVATATTGPGRCSTMMKEERYGWNV